MTGHLEFVAGCMTISEAMPKNAEKEAPKSGSGRNGDPVSLKDLALHLGLSPTTLSLVLNDSPQAASILSLIHISEPTRPY